LSEPETSARSSRALVLAGGGVSGIAWMLGLIDGLRRRDVDLGTADLIVGTSAGACVGAAVATGALEQAVEQQRQADSSEVMVPFDPATYFATLTRLEAESPDPRSGLLRIANIDPLGPTISAAERRAVIAVRLPVHDWPRKRLLVTAIDAQEGELVTFDRESGVDLVDAVTASCALPGVWPTATVDGRRYVDGGIRSPTNADLAGGHDIVVIVIPIQLNDYFRERLDAETRTLGSADVHVVAADNASLAAQGPNAMDPARRSVALEAGLAQAEREIDALPDDWQASEI
jgi:NTE family protein